MKKVFPIEVDCPVCAGKCENAIKKVEGVIDCSVNYVTQKMVFEAEDGKFDEILKKAIKVAKDVEEDFEVEL